MLDIVLEVARSLVMLVIFGFLLVTGRKHEIYKQRGWHFIVTGFGLLLLGSLFDITDNFESLNRYVVIGDTPAEAVLEKVFGYLLGFALLFAGFWYWLPLVGALRAAERRLETYSEGLKAKVAERTVELESANEELQAGITERKRAEEAMRESEARYRDLFKHSPIGIEEEDYSAVKPMIDRLREEGVRDFRRYFREHPKVLREMVETIKITDVNQALLDAYRISDKETFVQWDDNPARIDSWMSFYEQEVAALAEGKTRFALEYAAKAYDGSDIVIRVITSVGEAHKDSWARVITTEEDITERKRADEAMRESEARYRDLFKHLPIGVLEEDYSAIKPIIDRLRKKGVRKFRRYFREHPKVLRQAINAIKITDVNQALLDAYRMPDKETYLRTEGEAATISEWASYYEQMFTALAEGKRRFALEYASKAFDGSDIVTRLIVRIGDAYKDNWARVISTEEDITERKRADEALRESEERYRDIVESVGDLIQSVGPDGKYIYVNEAWRKVLGYSEEEVKNLSFIDIVHEDYIPHCKKIFQDLLRGKTRKNVEIVFNTKDGREVVVEGDLSSVRRRGKIVRTHAIFRDITERKRAEKALERLSHQNELILNSAGEGIYGLDLEGRTTFINPAATRMIGWEPEDLIGQPQHAILHHTRPDGSPYPREECLIYAAFKDGTVHHVTDEVFWRQDGTSFPVEYVSTPILEDGKPVGAVVVFRDITEQIAQRVEIERVASDLSQLIDTANAPILGVDNRGLINEWNQMAAKIVGYSKEEVLAWSLVDKFIGDDDKAAVKKVLDKAIAGHETANFEFTLYSKSGERVEMLLNATPRRDSAGNIVGVIGVGQDITERKRAEGALRESEARAQAIVNTAADAIITIDERGIIERFNPASERLFGYTADAAIGRNVKILMPSPYHDEHDSYLARYLSTGEKKIIGIGREVIGKRKDGTTFPIELAVGEVRLGDRRIFTGIIRDITERKRIERTKNEFISIVSHELRTPLTSIVGSLGLIRGGVLGKLPKQAKEMIDIAHKNSDRLVRLINDMLDIEKIEAGKIELRIEPLELIPLIEQAIEENRAYGKEFGVAFAIEHAVPGVKVYADSDRLIQVITNLLSNAAKFSPRGDTVEFSVSRHDGAIRVAVADHGPGIPEEFRDRIFQKFAQADSSDAREKGGTGLGLSICKAIVEKLGGRIGFDTETGAGTTFYFDLPEWREAEAGDIAETKAGDRPRVLICEDDRDIASLLKMMLDQGGYESDIAYTAGQAKQMLARQSYVAMTLDLLLPDRNGISLVRELRADENMRSFPIIVVSIVAEDTKKAVDGGTLEIIDWLDKPIDQTRLLAVINAAVRKESTDRPRILHIEDDADVLRVVSTLLSDRAEMSQAATLREARKMLRQQHFDLVLLDLVMPDGSGTELLPLINKQTPPIPVVVFSAYEVDGATAKMVAAILIKSRTSNEQLLDAIMAVIENG